MSLSTDPMSARPAAAPFVPVIPAGGSGSRLWPLSRRAHPKFLLDLTGAGRSLLQQTVDRLLPLADRAPIVVTGAAHREAVADQVGPGSRVVDEPSPRGSMAAIALAAAFAVRDDEDAIIGSFAADHLIGDLAAFEDAVGAARRAAAQGYLVTIGIEPTFPSTGFGYIEPAASTPDPLADAGARAAARFVEKPDAATAARFVDAGLLWNAGMFVVSASVLLDELAAQLPPLAAGVRRIAEAWGTAEERSVLKSVWPGLVSIAIDHALAEPLAAAGRVAVVPGAFGWDDVGDFAALGRQLRERGAGSAGGRGDGVRAAADGAAGPAAADAGPAPSADDDLAVLGGAHAVALDASGTVYGGPETFVALVGVQGVSVVDTGDAILVLDDAAAQRLSALGDVLESEGRGDLR